MDWYVARDGETFGPFPFEVMIKGIRDGELTPQDLVWSEGAPDWQPASSVPGLFSPPSLSALPPLTASQPNDASQRETEPGDPQAKADVGSSINENPSLIRRHWRGELSLGRAYWGVGVAVTVGAIGLQHFFAALVHGNGMGMLQFGMALTGLFLFIALCTLWQLVGVWRSAGRHMQSSQSRVPGAIARLTLILAVALVARDFGAVLGPFVLENWSPASRKADEATHELRLLRNGTEIELSGRLSEGTAIAVRQLLDAAPGVQVVHLNSAGGSVAEGYEIYQLIRDRKLITYTATDCASACTIAFLGGSQRLLSTGARLGFHSANIRGVDQRYIPAINAEMRRTLMSHGAPESFVTKAFSTSADSMWYPTKSELAAAKVVTGVVDPDQFALSGVSNWRDQEAIERSLLTFPLYAIVRDNDPEMFKKIANRFAEGVRLGKSLIEITQDAQSVFASEVIPKYLMRACQGQCIATGGLKSTKFGTSTKPIRIHVSPISCHSFAPQRTSSLTLSQHTFSKQMSMH